MRELVFPLLLLSSVFVISEATLCYQCSDAKSDGGCRNDIQGLLSDRHRFQNSTNITITDLNSKFTFLKNCSTAWGEQCLIENIRQAGTGQMLSFMRGCTNGKVFSLTDFPNRTIVPDNQTTCAFRPGSGKVVVCLTTCRTDFCNGPQPFTEAGSAGCSLSLVLVVAMYMVHVVLLMQ
uniref:Uncharacterized protein LOC111130454 n=1 Tax=Crassostrea virginica TaxID=6565 RepID=A0A8B8E0I5_CRAVI|nr:uncharacterized protein LOC111130454 [Crassostrea virginica]